MIRITGYLCLFSALSVASFGNTDQLAEQMKELRAEKRQIASAANELGTLARSSHINSWQTHATALVKLKELVNRSGARIARLQAQAAGSSELASLRDELAGVAGHVTQLKQSLNENQLATTTPAYFKEVMKLVRAAERSEEVAERLLASLMQPRVTWSQTNSIRVPSEAPASAQ